jgi:hypothetical protein
MKKQLLTLALLGMGIANAQTWSEDFNSTASQALPAGWLQNNVDGLTVASNLSSFNFGTNAWVTNAQTSEWSGQGRVVMSTSWYSSPGTSNDWLITPQFNVPAGSYLEWAAASVEAAYADGYIVKISTTGTLTTDFATQLFSIASEVTPASYSSPFTERSISLSAYVGQNVRIAFINNSNDKNRLYLDDIKCVVPAASNGNVVSVTSVPRYMVAGTSIVSGVFKNKGSNVANNITMNYQIDAGPITTQTLNVGALNYLQTANYTFTGTANLTAGTHTVKVFVTQVNGVAETITTDDMQTTVVYVASQIKTRNALIEEFSSSTCVPCQNLNATFDPLLQTNTPNTGGRVNVVKYQMNWPSPGNDPSYNPEGDDRKAFYGVSGIPDAFTNGRTEMSSHNQAEIDAAKAEDAYADITATMSIVGNQITASSTITPYLTISSNSPLRTFQVLTQSTYNYPGAVTTQKNYYHIQRKMYPDGQGSPVTVTDGVPFSASCNHNVVTSATPAQGSFDFWTTTGIVYEYVVFVQDEISGHILNSGSATTAMSTGLVQLTKDARIGVYPNPAKDFAVVGIRLNNSSVVDINIYDVTGKIVYSQKGAQVAQGENEIRINTSEFANGAYNIVVTTAEGTLKDKLIVNK